MIVAKQEEYCWLRGRHFLRMEKEGEREWVFKSRTVAKQEDGWLRRRIIV